MLRRTQVDIPLLHRHPAVGNIGGLFLQVCSPILLAFLYWALLFLGLYYSLVA